MDIGTGIALLGPAKIVERILGPTADYIGGSLASWTKVRVENVQRVFANAVAKLGRRLDEPGAVPPKTLKAVLDGASFAPDPLAAEYFGGVLASSRTTTPRDDRGASLAALVESLSAYELRTHYLVYESVFRLYAGTRRQPQQGTEGLAVYLPYDSYSRAMAFDDTERAHEGAYMVHAFYGLKAKAWGALGSVEGRGLGVGDPPDAQTPPSLQPRVSRTPPRSRPIGTHAGEPRA